MCSAGGKKYLSISSAQIWKVKSPSLQATMIRELFWQHLERSSPVNTPTHLWSTLNTSLQLPPPSLARASRASDPPTAATVCTFCTENWALISAYPVHVTCPRASVEAAVPIQYSLVPGKAPREVLQMSRARERLFRQR